MTDVILEHGLKAEGITLKSGLDSLASIDLRTLEGKTPYPFSLRISQHQVERLLRKKLMELGVPLHSNKVMTAYTYDHDHEGVLAEFEDGSKVRARYLVGTDGARSTVRKLSNISFYDPFSNVSYDEPSDSPFYIALADVIFKSPVPAAISSDQLAANIDNFLFAIPLPSTEPDRPGLMWRVGLGTPSTKGTDVQIPKELSLEYVQRILDERNYFPERLVIDRLMTASRYRVRAALAEKYFVTVGDDASHAGYVLLAGDAAHVHSPVGGQGMNLGLCDAYELAQAIHGHIQGNSEALAAYSEKRHEIGRRVVRLTKGLTMVLANGVGWRRVVRNLLLRMLGRMPWIKKRIVWSISGLGNK